MRTEETASKGLGVYCIHPFAPGNVVLVFGGEVLDVSEVPYPLTPEKDHYLQIGLGVFLGPSGGVDDLVNHSCDPNCIVKIDGTKAWLVAIKPISEGEELSFDYSTTSNDTPSTWSLACRCGTSLCRGVVSGVSSIPTSVLERYRALGAVPSYLP